MKRKLSVFIKISVLLVYAILVANVCNAQEFRYMLQGICCSMQGINIQIESLVITPKLESTHVQISQKNRLVTLQASLLKVVTNLGTTYAIDSSLLIKRQRLW